MSMVEVFAIVPQSVVAISVRIPPGLYCRLMMQIQEQLPCEACNLQSRVVFKVHWFNL